MLVPLTYDLARGARANSVLSIILTIGAASAFYGVVQYAASDTRVIAECHRVLRPGGLAMFQVYNRRSWLQLLSNGFEVGTAGRVGGSDRAPCRH